MNDTQKQFIAVCPQCSTILRVGFNHLGRNVCCQQCHYTFVAGEAIDSAAEQAGGRMDGPSSAPPDQVDRIQAVCPSCKATLHVRRAYVGNQVRCKYCDQVFRVLVPAELQPKTEQNPPSDPSERLRAEHEQLDVAHNLLMADHEQLKTEYDRLSDDLHRATTDLDALRAALGTISPAEVRSLAEQRESLGAEVDRFRDELQALRAEQTARDQLAAELEQRVAELDLANQTHQAERDRQCALLAALGERHRALEEQHQSVEELCEQYQDRNQELFEAKERLEVENHRLRESLESQPATWAGSRPELHLVSNETSQQPDPSRIAILDPAAGCSTSAAELDDVRAQLEELKQRLDEAQHLNGEMAAVLAGMGIRCRPNPG